MHRRKVAYIMQQVDAHAHVYADVEADADACVYVHDEAYVNAHAHVDAEERVDADADVYVDSVAIAYGQRTHEYVAVSTDADDAKRTRLQTHLPAHTRVALKLNEQTTQTQMGTKTRARRRRPCQL